MRLIRIILGSIISLILSFSWIIILTALGFTFFYGKIDSIIMWLIVGPYLVYFFASQYILCNNSTEHKEKINYLRDMKITLMGFSLWLVVIMGFFLFQMNIDYYVNIGGGYLTILIIYSKFHIPSPH